MAMTGEHARSSQARSEGTEAGTSRSRPKRYKATNMSFDEMVELVEIMRRKDYDGQYGPYKTPNRRKGKIMEKVARKMQRMFGIARSKEQLRKRWSDLKLREPHQLKKIKKILKKRERRRQQFEEAERARHARDLPSGHVEEEEGIEEDVEEEVEGRDEDVEEEVEGRDEDVEEEVEGREEDVEEEEEEGREDDGVILDLVVVEEEDEIEEEDVADFEDGGLVEEEEGGVIEDGEVVEEEEINTTSGQCHPSLIGQNRCR